MGASLPHVDDFLCDLASATPVPGGGSVAGFEVAMGAALIVMVCELTLGREKFASVQDEVERIRDAANAIRHDGRRLVDEDAAAFSLVAATMKLPRGTDDERAARREAMQSALKGAVDPPLRTMVAARDGLARAAELAPIGNPSAISDVGSGALALSAGYHAAKLNVEINLASIRDEPFVAEIRDKMPDDGAVDGACRSIVEEVLCAIRGG